MEINGGQLELIKLTLNQLLGSLSIISYVLNIIFQLCFTLKCMIAWISYGGSTLKM